MAMGIERAAMLPNKIPISLTMSRNILDFCDYRYRAGSMGTNRHNPRPCARPPPVSHLPFLSKLFGRSKYIRSQVWKEKEHCSFKIKLKLAPRALSRSGLVYFGAVNEINNESWMHACMHLCPLSPRIK